MMTGMTLEECLRQRRFEAPSTNLAERIIACARERDPVSEFDFAVYFREFISSVIPRPAFALAFVLIIGILIGSDLSLTQLQNSATVTTDEEAVL